MSKFHCGRASAIKSMIVTLAVLMAVSMTLLGCGSKSAADVQSMDHAPGATQIGSRPNWRLAPDPCRLFGLGNSIDFGDGSPILKKTSDSHLAAVGERLCDWEGKDLGITVSIITDKSTIPHYALRVDLPDGENVDIGLDEAQVVWASYGGSSSAVEAVYNDVKMRLIIFGKLSESQKQTIYTMLAGALQSAARRN